ncbi:MAG: 6-carboxytetrahydropterin synthase QueD [Actinomycetota bacterium]|jgi:6-pyruvoyltetrahydropterin/6-carboxytetrahydropterin synthase|nr:6-carboxytetrahydropterin synthase QueD [Actinomycetota bacterium]
MHDDHLKLRTRVTCSVTFEAAHHLPWHAGRCHRLHGHSYRMEVTVEGHLDANGVVIDFDEMSARLVEVVTERYDHRLLNDIIDNPTAERIAHEAWGAVAAAGLPVVALRLWETPDAFVEILGD